MSPRYAGVIGAAALMALSIIPGTSSHAQPAWHPIRVIAGETLDSLLEDEDTDGDKKITIDDPHLPGSFRGDKRFWILTSDNQRCEISGTYFLSNLLQELRLAQENRLDSVELRPDRIFELPVSRISRLIRELYWDGLTRRVDEQGLAKIFIDEKTVTIDGFRYVYVPYSDTLAHRYFVEVSSRHREWKMKVVRLPEKITPAYVRSLEGRHGILSLEIRPGAAGRGYEGIPFVVPGGRFNEMYGWDSYFIVLGLLRDGRIDLAKSMADNFIYEITHYGAILNANRSYYLTRSQPPFFTSMALAVYEDLPKDSSSREWLRRAILAAIREYNEVWMNPLRLTATGLSRYYDAGIGPPPEVEPGRFDAVYAPYAAKLAKDLKTFEAEYRSGKLDVVELNAYFTHDRSMRESGHDASYRLESRCADLVTADLNSLLYKIEVDIARTLEKEFSGTLVSAPGRVEESARWFKRAERRRDLINRYLWNRDRGMFFDYDFVHHRQSDYLSATTMYPLWAGLATREQAEQLITRALPLLEMPGGIAASTEKSRGRITPDRPLRQWDFPFGWAPHQMLVWRALLNAGKDSIAQRLIYRWLYTMVVNAVNHNGTIPEKFDVVNRTHQVFAEYGNVGTKFSYITREGFGWTNASYEVGLSILPKQSRDSLDRLIPPEWIYKSR